MHDITLVQIEL